MATLTLNSSTGPVRFEAQPISNKVAMHVGAAGRVYFTADEADAAAELQRAAAELRQATSSEVAA